MALVRARIRGNLGWRSWRHFYCSCAYVYHKRKQYFKVCLRTLSALPPPRHMLCVCITSRNHKGYAYNHVHPLAKPKENDLP
jgi:hypothetical protein